MPDALSVPGAIAVPPPPGILDPVGGWDAGERFAILLSVVTGLRTTACSAWSHSPAGHDLSLVEPGDGGNLGCFRRSSRTAKRPQVRLRSALSFSSICLPASLSGPSPPRPRLPGPDARYPGPTPVAWEDSAAAFITRRVALMLARSPSRLAAMISAARSGACAAAARR